MTNKGTLLSISNLNKERVSQGQLISIHWGATPGRINGYDFCVCVPCWMKKANKEMQTLRTGCSKEKPKFFAPPHSPFPGAQDGQNLISWRWSLPLPTNPVWRGLMHAVSSYHGNRPTNTQTYSQDWLQYTAPLSLAHSVTKGNWCKVFVVGCRSCCQATGITHWSSSFL